MKIEEIYEEYFDEIDNYVNKIVSNQFMRDDVINETFYKAMIASDTYRADGSMSAWLKTIARNCYYNKLRELKYISVVDNIDEHYNLSVTDDTISHMIVYEDVRRARLILHSLPPPYLEVYMWRAFIGLKHKEIGELFGMNENWSNQVYLRAKKKILDEFKD